MIRHECMIQSRMFVKWHHAKKHATFHSSHYDWWAFPVDQPSSYRDKYQIGPVERSQLIQDK